MTRLYSVATLGFALLCVPTLAAAQTPDLPSAVEEPVVQADPPAHVSVVDGVAVLERDGEIDDSPANMPLLAGDRVRTRDGRVEILFADGAALHLDANTTVDFQSDELVRLLDGRIRLSIPGPVRAVYYRIDAPSGWVAINQPGEYRLAILPGRSGEELELAVLRGGAELLTESGRTMLRAGERAYARADAPPSSAYVFNSAQWDAFDRWSETQRDDRLGLSAQYLPDEVRPYAGSFDRYGSWRSDPSHGYVWYPRVGADWRPYYHGRWVPLPSYGWTWIGRDRWHWPTHHYGRWGISRGAWFWIPGRRWASAWVSWAIAPGYVSWCPLGWNNRPIIQINVFNGFNRWHPWTVVPRRHFGVGFVHARAISLRGFDARTRGSFAYRASGPDVRAHVRPRAPIRSAGARLDRAVPRGSSPLYTNLQPGASRVRSGSRRVMVPPSASAAGASRSRGDGMRAPGGARAVPRERIGDAPPDQRRQVQAPARRRSGLPADRASTPSRAAPEGASRRGVRAMPRIEPPADRATPAPSRRAVPRGIQRGTPANPAANVWRGRADAGRADRSRGIARERSMPAPPPTSAGPSRSAAPPAYGRPGPGRRAPESARPSGTRAVPRGGAGARPGNSPRPSHAQPGRSGPSQARPGAASPRGGGPPGAGPASRPAPAKSAPGARPRPGGERSGGTAVPRRRGGV